MGLFSEIAGAVVGKAVGSIFGGGSDSAQGAAPARNVTYQTPQDQSVGLLAKSVMSGRQQLESSMRGGESVQGPYKGGGSTQGGKGLKSAPLISDEARFWGTLFNRAINESQVTMPTSAKEQHGPFKR